MACPGSGPWPASLSNLQRADNHGCAKKSSCARKGPNTHNHWVRKAAVHAMKSASSLGFVRTKSVCPLRASKRPHVALPDRWQATRRRVLCAQGAQGRAGHEGRGTPGASTQAAARRARAARERRASSAPAGPGSAGRSDVRQGSTCNGKEVKPAKKGGGVPLQNRIFEIEEIQKSALITLLEISSRSRRCARLCCTTSPAGWLYFQRLGKSTRSVH